jgi:hypothetical protein
MPFATALPASCRRSREFSVAVSISAIFTPPYRLMAVQRHRISALLGMNACKLPEHKLPDPAVRA